MNMAHEVSMRSILRESSDRSLSEWLLALVKHLPSGNHCALQWLRSFI